MKNYILFLLLFLLIGLWVAQGIFLPISDEDASRKFQVKAGQGLFETSKKLEEENLIKNDLWFNVYSLLKGRSQTIKAGTYSLNREMSVAEIYEKMVLGEVMFNKITVVEGWTIEDIGQRIEEKGWHQAQDFYEIVGYPVPEKDDFQLPASFKQKYDFLRGFPEKRRLEGYLFPDTYYVDDEGGLQKLVEKMLGNFEKKFSTLDKDEKRSDFKIITMASLLEKEVRTKKDKRIVAGILWKRLERGMPLQVDATISYITGKNTTKVSRKETEIDSPYNTYKYPGLPWGPICNPGLESLEAALNPIATDYWYYLSVPGGECPQCSEGGTYFSKSLRQHNIGKARYLSN